VRAVALLGDTKTVLLNVAKGTFVTTASAMRTIEGEVVTVWLSFVFVLRLCRPRPETSTSSRLLRIIGDPELQIDEISEKVERVRDLGVQIVKGVVELPTLD
jgi:hypothetical protein